MDSIDQSCRVKIDSLMEEYRQYGNRWASNSDYFSKNSFYAWMARKIHEKHRILEIGCGVGLSTLALLKDNHTVFAIDENPECINTAFELTMPEYKSSRHLRACRAIVDGNIETTYSDICIEEPGCKAIFIESNIATDPILDMKLDSLSLDAVVCWMIGTHWKNRDYDNSMKKINAGNPEEYRNTIHELIFQKADSFLKPDGIVHIVDRGTRCTSEDQIYSFTQFYSYLARGTGFELSGYDQIPYDGSKIQKGVMMGAKGKSLRKAELQTSALHSIIFTKVL